MASRSGGNEGLPTDKAGSEEPTKPVVDIRSRRPTVGDGAEVTVHLRIGYKTVLLVVVVFDFVHLSVRELLNAGWVEQMLGFGP